MGNPDKGRAQPHPSAGRCGNYEIFGIEGIDDSLHGRFGQIDSSRKLAKTHAIAAFKGSQDLGSASYHLDSIPVTRFGFCFRPLYH
jgi:hypothetical protein